MRATIEFFNALDNRQRDHERRNGHSNQGINTHIDAANAVFNERLSGMVSDSGTTFDDMCMDITTIEKPTVNYDNVEHYVGVY